MEKPSDSPAKILMQRIEELELRLQSFEGNLSDLRRELESVKESASSMTEEEILAPYPITPESPPEAVLEKPDLSSQQVPPEPAGADYRDSSVTRLIEEPDTFPVSIPGPEVEEGKTDSAASMAATGPEDSSTEHLSGEAVFPTSSETAAEKSAMPKEFFQPAAMESNLPLESVSASGPDETKSIMDLETRIGAIWFNRLGLVALIIGFGLLARYITPHLKPWHKVLGSYLSSGLLFCCGWYFERRLRHFARPVMAGALSIIFFVSFAAHFVKPMACVPLWMSLLLMSASVGFTFLCAERWRSEPTAGLAIFLGHVAAFVAGGDADTYSLVAILFLSLSALALLLRHNWVPLSLFAVFAAFVSHLLWAILDHAPSSPEFQFWINFQFLTSYYCIFLASDLISRHRIFKRGIASFTVKQQAAGRAVGPASMVLYVTLTASFFHATKIYWDQIHFFLFPLAALQIILFRYHRQRANPDCALYLVASILFGTLGLFSWIEGLSLNMSLAALALLLLVLSRRMGMGFLSLLAELVLMVNFLHFWLSDASTIDSWPTFLGSVMIAMVYFVKSRLEETWQVRLQNEAIVEAPWSSAAQDIYQKLAHPFAYIHAAAGSMLVLYQCVTFFDAPWDAVMLAGFSLAGVASAALLASCPLACSTWALQAGFLCMLAIHRTNFFNIFSADPSWSTTGMIDQGACLAILGTAMTMMAIARRRYEPMTAILGMGSMILTVPAIFISAGIGNSSLWFMVFYALGPLAFWLETEFFAVQFHPGKNMVGADDLKARAILATNRNKSFIRGALALTAAFLTYRVLSQVVASTWLVLLLLTLIAAGLFAYTIRRNSLYLLLGFTTHSLLTALFFVHRFSPKAVWGDRLLSWWFITFAAWTGATLIAIAFKRKQASFVWSGLFLLVAAMQGITRCLDVQTVHFQPFVLWLAAVAFFWVASEVLLRGFAGDSSDPRNWCERLGLEFLSQSHKYLSVGISMAAAGFLAVISYRYLDMKSADNVFALLSGSVSLFALVFFALTGLLRSPSMCAAYAVLLSIAHGIFQFHLGRIGISASGYLFLSTFLFGISFLFGGITEWFLQNRRAILKASQLMWAGIGSWYPYALSFLLSALFFRHPIQALISSESSEYQNILFRFPPQMLLAILAVILGRRFRLPRMQLSAFVYSLWVATNMAGWVLFSPSYRAGLLSTGTLVFFLIIAFERIIARQDSEILQSYKNNLPQLMKNILAIGSGTFMLLVIPFSDAVRGYWTTVSMSLVALTLMGLGFLWQERIYRRTALGLFTISIFRIVFIDIAHLGAFYRMMAFFTLGGCLVLVSFFYSRFRKQIKRWL